MSLCVMRLLAGGGLRSKAELLLSLVLLRVLSRYSMRLRPVTNSLASQRKASLHEQHVLYIAFFWEN
jgi:hypothetical protein